LNKPPKEANMDNPG